MGTSRHQKIISFFLVWTTTLLLCSRTAFGWGSYQSSEYEEDHIDFTDMGSYNHGFQKNLNARQNGIGSPEGLEEETIKITRYRYDSTDPTFDEQDGSLSTKVGAPSHSGDRGIGVVDNPGLKTVEIIEASKKYQSVQATFSSVNDSTSMKFLKRIVASLLRQMNVRGHVFGPGEAITIDLQAEISHANFMTLTKFVGDETVDGTQYLTQVDAILSNMLHVIAAPLTPNFLETLKDSLFSLFTVITPKTVIIVSILSLFLFIVSGIAWKIRYSRSVYKMVVYGFVIIFLVSCVWTFISMYEDAKAKNYSRIMQTQEAPTDCEFDRMGAWDSASYFFRIHVLKYEDRCVEYNKEVMVDPIWRTSPIEAISHTFASLIFHPAEYIGSKLGKFFYNASSVFPFWLQPFVLILLFVFVFLGVFRFRISTPFGSIEPARSNRNNVGGGNNMLNEAERSPEQLEQERLREKQIAEIPAAEVVEVRTRDACVDTSDFEEYLEQLNQARNRRQSEPENSPQIPELPSSRRYNFTFFTSWIKRSSLLCLVISGLFNLVTILLDKILRQVPFAGFEANSVSTEFAIP